MNKHKHKLLNTVSRFCNIDVNVLYGNDELILAESKLIFQR